MIFLLNGAIQSGKTTALGQFCRRAGCDGLLSPLIEGRRFFRRIRNGETRAMETTGPGIHIGRFCFDPAAFAWANQQIEEAWLCNPEWLVIDEIGPLELNGQGLRPAMDYLLSQAEANKNLIFVVRRGLEQAVIELLNGRAYRIIEKNELENL